MIYLQKVDTVMVLYMGPWIYGEKKRILLRTVMRVSEKNFLFLFLFVYLDTAYVFPYPTAVHVLL